MVNSRFELKNFLGFQERISKRKQCYVILRSVKQLYKVRYTLSDLNHCNAFPAIVNVEEQFRVGWAKHSKRDIFSFEEFVREWIDRTGPCYEIKNYQIVAWLELCSSHLFQNAFQHIKQKM